MKKLHLVIILALIISGLFVSQASAATTSSNAAASACGKTYTVVGGDTLTKIADKCGTSVPAILAINPTIINVNMIYTGQVINLTGVASASAVSIPSYGSAFITISTDGRVYPGKSFVVKGFNFPKNTSVKISLFERGSSTAKRSYDATTNAFGYVTRTVTIPVTASDGQKWMIKVATNNERYGASVTSSVITIISKSDDDDTINAKYPDAEVTLSRYSAKAGDTVNVYVKDFPKNVYINFCVRKKAESLCRAVYYSLTDGNGYNQMSITIPSSAKAGDNWAVFVQTLYLSNVISDLSPRITIK